FSTRLGGVSGGIWSSMNLNFGRGDDEANVLANFRLYAEATGTDVDNMVYSMQTHTTNVIRVGRADCGNGVTKPQRFNDVDGLVTNEPGVCLVTTYADCVPLYFVDTKNRAIGLSHSGWRGTVGNITQVTVSLMRSEFGTKPEDIIAFIGPSICKSCYEVSGDVAEKFKAAYSAEEIEDILTDKGMINKEHKYLLNLHAANVANMVNAGIPADNINVTDICTCCNPDFLYSHRASGGRRGGLCAFLELR
ncbi:MAG TPA: peptidoglycan editing factor PgeF, partial [Bacteroides sp.]|nr:peptidoglycan editing factor PgeF [Bacteroides sp.]